MSSQQTTIPSTTTTFEQTDNTKPTSQQHDSITSKLESLSWDAMYEEEEEDLGNLDSQGSVIKHLISQIRIGMDLTKVVLPTFILERRSLLEMYADFFAHPDLFSSIPDFKTPEERMIQLVKWYMSAFHAGRRSSVAKKPYNPILGEMFICHWDLSQDSGNVELKCNENCDDIIARDNNNLNSSDIVTGDNNKSNPVCDIENYCRSLPKNNLLFVAEQVSHHPPVSAFYVQNPSKKIECCSHIYTKSKFLGLSVGVHNIGEGKVELLEHNETYVCNFPSAYGRSILTVPWVELGGQITINCVQTGYSATIDFVTKPFYGGKKHGIVGEIFGSNKEKIMSLEGEWNGVMFSTRCSDGKKETFVDTKTMPVIKKKVRSVYNQLPFESRNVWKEVTQSLKARDVTRATSAKTLIEQRQRDLLSERSERGEAWKPRFFEAVGDKWIVKQNLKGI